MLRSTRTYATMEVSKATFDEIAAKMRDAGYDHVFLNRGETIDMHGIALEMEEQNDESTAG